MRLFKVFLIAAALAFYTMSVFAQINPMYGEKLNVIYEPVLIDIGGNGKNDITLSPDGTLVAFVNMINQTQEGIWLVPSGGGTATLLYNARDVNYLRFMPDGKEIYFEETIWITEPDTLIEGYTLKVVNIENKEVRVLIENASMANVSDDGRYISYIYRASNTEISEQKTIHNGAIVIYDMQSGEKRYLIDDNQSRFEITMYHYPTISPDMNWVYFHNSINYPSIAGELFRMPFEGGEIEQLSFFDYSGFGFCKNLHFSPNGKWLMFDYCFDILVYNIESMEFYSPFSGENIDTPAGPDQGRFISEPNWMPDEKSFVYGLHNGGQNSGPVTKETIGAEIYICKLDDSIDGGSLSDNNPLAVESENPECFEILTNYPNPFNPSTTLEFTVTKPGQVDVSVYNITGQKVCELFSGFVTAGKHSIVWNGLDSRGVSLSSGIYISRLKTKDNVILNSMVLFK